MATCTVQGAPVVRGIVQLPRVGVWHADFEVDADSADDFAGKLSVSIGDGALSLSGTAFRSGTAQGRVLVRAMGGAGGLATELAAKSYQAVPLKMVLGDILRAAGETLSARADTVVLSTQLAKWQLLEERCSKALIALMARAPDGTAWRFLPDGTFWLGPEQWPNVELAFDLIREDPHLGRFEVAIEEPTLTPGVTFRGQKVGYVVHRIQPDRVRSTVWTES